MRVIILAVNPEMPQIEIIEKSLSEIPFPVSFRLCVDGENELESYGYNNTFDYFLGTSKFNRSVIGWNGHNSDGSIVGTVQGFDLFRGDFRKNKQMI